jgi:DNA polymerase-3 subunit delta
VASLCNKQVERALVQYHTMLAMKEQPLMVLAMMARQFRIILQCKDCADKRMTESQIMSALGLRNFIVREGLRQARNFTHEKLLGALADCQDTDIRIKTGQIGGEIGVELLIVRYAA